MTNIDNIADLHDEVLELLLEYRKENNSDLRFQLRPHDNSSNKGYLNKGRWFFGNEEAFDLNFMQNRIFPTKKKTSLLGFIVSLNPYNIIFDFYHFQFEKPYNSFSKYLVEKFGITPDNGNLEIIISEAKDNFKIKLRELVQIIDKFLKSEEFQNHEKFTLIPKEEFEKNLTYIQKKRKEIKLRKAQELLHNTFESDTIKKVFVTNFSITNYYAIKNTAIQDLPKEAPWIFLTGENGAGKSLVLQALAIGLYGNKEETIIPKDKKTSIEVTYSTQGDKIYKNHTKPRKEFTSLPYLACFGPIRLDVQTEGSENKSSKRSTATYGLFGNYDALFKNIETELKFAFYENQKKYDVLVQMLKSVIPSLHHVEFDKRNRTIQYFEKQSKGKDEIYKPVIFSALATGIKSIIAMVGDIYLRFSALREDINKTKYLLPEELYGIVIIDELDLHLHPKWQKELPTLLSTVFPNIQFIASTHSPIPILGAPKGSAFLVVNRSAVKGITVERVEMEVENLTPNLILSSQIFGYQDITAKTNTSKQDVRTEDTTKEKDFRDELRDRLLRFAEENNGELKNLVKN